MSIETIAQTSNSGISSARSFIDNKANTLLKPKSAEGVSGFLFDVEDQDSLTLSADITDHYTENNSFVNDHIVRKPVIISVSGFIGEVVFRKPDGIEGTFQAISNRLETVEAYLGDLTPGAVQIAQQAIQKAQSVVSDINRALDKVQNIVGLFEGETGEPTLQQKAFQDLNALFLSSEFVTVQTPWKYYDNMIIQTISFAQGSESKSMSDISITLKELRVSETKSVDFDQEQFPVREQIQASPEEDQGIIRGKDENVSALYSVFGG